MKFFLTTDYYRGSSKYLNWNLEILCLWSTHALVLFSVGTRIICFLCVWLPQHSPGLESSWNFTFFLGILLNTDWTAFSSGHLCVEWKECRSVVPCWNCPSSPYFLLISLYFPPLQLISVQDQLILQTAVMWVLSMLMFLCPWTSST